MASARFPTSASRSAPGPDAPADGRVRLLGTDDWDAVAALEARAYAACGLSEGRAALQSRARTSPETCFVLDLGPRIAGYLLALPCPPGRYPDLHRPEPRAVRSRNLHLHDLVVAEDLRRRGLAGRLLARLTAIAAARGYERVSLVAVGGSSGFWTARGFLPRPEVPVRSYGPGAQYMVLDLPPSPEPPGGAAPR